MEAKLTSLVLYNPLYGPKEGQEHLKLLYHYPPSEKLNVKLNKLGLCEALVQFTRNFSPNQPCEYLHTSKQRYVFLEVEDDFWMVMTVSNPVVTTKVYQESVLSDIVLKSILQTLYDQFKLFAGTLKNIVADHDGITKLKLILHDYFSKVLHPNIITNKDIIDVSSGIKYLSLDKTLFLELQSLTNNLKSEFSEIKHTHVVYEDSLLLSDLSKSDACVFNQFIIKELQPSNDMQAVFDNSLGGFITDIKNHVITSTESNALLVFVHGRSGNLKKHFVVIYRALALIVCMFIPKITNEGSLLSKIDVFLGEVLINFQTKLESVMSTNPLHYDPSCKFIQWDSSTLSITTQCHTKWKDGSLKCIVPPETMGIMLSIAEQFLRAPDDQEIVTKAENDYWVVGRKRNDQYLFIVISLKNANLIEVNEQVKRMCAENFKNFAVME